MHHVFWLSEFAYNEFVKIVGENDRRVQLKSDSPDHDLTLVDLRSCFEKNPLVKKFIAENELQSRQEYTDSSQFLDFVSLHADAVVELLVEGQHRYWIPLEYESSLKSIERCREKLADYYTRYNGKVVFFICKNETILERMMKIESDICKEGRPKMYFALHRDVLRDGKKLTFTTIKKTEHTFG